MRRREFLSSLGLAFFALRQRAEVTLRVEGMV